jgi:hypothetical protein
MIQKKILLTLFLILVLLVSPLAKEEEVPSTLETQIKEILREYPKLYSEAAVILLIGTAAQESHLGKYSRQINGGPALGIYQVEPETFRWLKRKYPRIIGGYRFEDLEFDLRASTLTARLRYWVVSEPLPSKYDLYGMARYWRTHFNTHLGKGRVEDFINNFFRYTKGAFHDEN